MLTKIAQSYAYGVQAARNAIAVKNDGEGLSKEASEKIAEDAVFGFAKLAEIRFDARQEAFEDVVAELKTRGYDKAAEELAEAADAEAEAVNEEANSEEEPDDEVKIEAMVQGAAEIIAAETGKAPEDEDVQNAAEEVIAEQIHADTPVEGEGE